MRRLQKWVSAVSAVPLLLALLLGATILIAFTPQVYFHEYDILHQEQTIGCERATLDNITYSLIDYMKGNAPNLEINAYIGGELRGVFSERDQAHMKDVKYLFDLARYGTVFGLVAWLVLWTVSFLVSQRADRGRNIAVGFLWGVGVFFALVAALAVYIALNFQTAFTQFHHIFFNNDLWQLPADSVLLQMMPTQFFVHLAAFIGALFAAGVAIVVAVALISRAVSMRKEKRLADQISEDREAAGELTLAARLAASVVEEPITAVRAPDGERYVLDGSQDERPHAEEIFEQFGLSDADDQPLMPDEDIATVKPAPEPEEPETVSGEPEAACDATAQEAAPAAPEAPVAEEAAPVSQSVSVEPNAQPVYAMPQAPELPPWGNTFAAQEAASAAPEAPVAEEAAAPQNAPAEPDAQPVYAMPQAPELPPWGNTFAAQEAAPAMPQAPVAEEAAAPQNAPAEADAQPVYTMPEAPKLPEAQAAATLPAVWSVAPASAQVLPAQGEDAPLTLRVPVRLPASALLSGNLAKGVTLELSIELAGEGEEAKPVVPPDDTPSMEDIMKSLDRIIAQMPGDDL